MSTLFNTPSERYRRLARKRIAKVGDWDEDQHPRDAQGRWTASGVAGAVAGFGAVLARRTLVDIGRDIAARRFSQVINRILTARRGGRRGRR